MKINISQPCPADWNKMKIAAIGRHCEHCEKTVVDFTKMSREEIVLFLMLNQGNSVCGRFRKNQLDHYHLEEMITLQQLRNMPPKKAALFLSLACVVLVSCQQPAPTKTQTTQIQKPEITATTDSVFESESDSTQIDATAKKAITTKTNTPEKDTVLEVRMTGMIEMGEVIEPFPVDTSEPIFRSDSAQLAQTIYTIVDQMPEFPGGMDSLFAFIKKNIRYPENAYEAEFVGRVYAQFVVEPDGSITNTTILRSAGIKSIDDEVLKVIAQMPKWNSGMQRGKAVRVYYAIPFSFRMD